MPPPGLPLYSIPFLASRGSTPDEAPSNPAYLIFLSLTLPVLYLVLSRLDTVGILKHQPTGVDAKGENEPYSKCKSTNSDEFDISFPH